MIFNIFFTILIFIIILILILFFIYIFKVSSDIVYNYKYLKEKYQELYDLVLSLNGIVDSESIKKLVDQINTNIETINILENRVNETQQNLNSTNKRIDNLEKSNEENKNNIKSINDNLTQNNEELKKINDDIKTINNQYLDFNNYKEELDKKINTINNEYEKYIQDKESLENNINTKIQEITTTIDSMKNEINSVKDVSDINAKDITSLNKKFEDNLKKVNDDISGIIKRLENVETSINTLNTTIKTLQDDINSIKSQINDINTKIDKLEENISKDISNIKQDIKNIQNSLQDVRNKISTLQTDIDSINKKIDEISSNLTKVNDKIKTLEEHDVSKNYFNFINVVSVYNFKSTDNTIYGNPFNDLDKILSSINLLDENYLTLLIIEGINFESSLFSDQTKPLKYFKKSDSEYIFLVNKAKNSDTSYVCDFFYFKTDIYNLKTTIYSNSKGSVLYLKFKDKDNFYVYNYYFFVSPTNDITYNLYKELFDAISLDYIASSSNSIFNLFMFTDGTITDKNDIKTFLYKNYSDYQVNSNTYNIITKLSSKFFYIGDFNILNQGIINEISDQRQIYSLVLINKFFLTYKIDPPSSIPN